MYDLDKLFLGINAGDFYCQLNFSKDQLDALRQIYNRYFEPLMPTEFNGAATAFVWDKEARAGSSKQQSVHTNVKIVFVNDAFYDPLWEEYFSDILPYMGTTGNVGLIPPGKEIYPHTDRSSRPIPIYFPIKGCSEKCFTDFYDRPKNNSETRQKLENPGNPSYSIPVANNGVMYNVREWHGVRNQSNETRVAFGWDTRDNTLSFADIKKIFKNLGYINAT